jgi:hypothetical protein
MNSFEVSSPLTFSAGAPQRARVYKTPNLDTYSARRPLSPRHLCSAQSQTSVAARP